MEAEKSKQPLFQFAYFPNMPDSLEKLSDLAEPEEWQYQNTPSDHERPILYNYLQYTYARLEEEEKIASSNDEHEQQATFNTGLVTPNQEPIYALFDKNRNADRQSWHFKLWCRKGQRELNVFSQLPEIAHYFDDPSSLVFDTKRKFDRIDVDHLIEHNKERFPESYKRMDNFPLQNNLQGAIKSAKERVKRNYKTAIPQYYHGKIQILLPLCLNSLTKADLALVVENHEKFYRAATCLTLDMAYSNARLLARPDRDWLQP